MMDRLQAMSIFLEVVKAGSLSGAGRSLGVPLATVSRNVSELEAHLGTRLLNRSSRRVTLTDAGRSYVEACKRILEDIGEAERAAAGEYSTPKGDLIITAPIVFGRLHVLPIAIEFLRSYPDIGIRLVQADHMINMLEDQVDLAVRIGQLPDSSLVATRVGAIRRVTCGSPAYLAARGLPTRPDDLVAHDCITFEGLMATDGWSFGAGRSEAIVPIRSRLVVNTAEAAVDAAIAGIGITRVLSYQVAQAVHSGALTVLLENFEPPPSPVNLVRAGQRLLPLKLRTFLDFAAPRLRSRLLESAP